ncbi:hypothetical protein V7201_16195 [Bacillus sp. JJ1122]
MSVEGPTVEVVLGLHLSGPKPKSGGDWLTPTSAGGPDSEVVL